ncbi:unnamed protein product [Adineta ricciae]|uniref:Fibronectin type-III domain-containing protein n=1 Tax=Adineta ricciae TaxID=249248 RepID=A0A814UQ57_ADIRI|nr:unnamed protein product [Adineta ricciae]
MSEFQSDVSSYETTSSNLPAPIDVELSSQGNIFVDWNQLARPANVRHCIIHYRSLNNNQSHTIRVSRKKQNSYLRKTQPGHLYEVHVCAVDSSDRIIAASQCAQIQTRGENEGPRLRVTEATPDYVWLEWKKSDEVHLTDIKMYKLVINGETKVILPSEETRYVVSDGNVGEKYVFQIEMLRKDGKIASSVPIHVTWPGVTIPKTQAICHACKELMISWGDSTSINNGNIESYTLHLYDSKGELLTKVGPNSPECREVWIKDVDKGVYTYILEIKLANSNKSVYSKPTRVECGSDSRLPILTYEYSDSMEKKELTDLAHHLISARDNTKSKTLIDRCEHQLQQILSLLNRYTEKVRINLKIQSNSTEHVLQTYRLIIDGVELDKSIPGTVKQYPLELARRDEPYKLAVSVTPALYGTQSKPISVEASGYLTFFCTHFDQHKSSAGCAYLDTLPCEQQLRRPIHQGLLKVTQAMETIDLYDLRANKTVQVPSFRKERRLTILFFYLNTCVPARHQLTYFADYASHNRGKYIYTSIHYIEKENDKPLHEALSLEGVPMYFVLDFAGRIVWRGRICAQEQVEYNVHMDHILAEVNTIQCPSPDCELCRYCSLTDADLKEDLTEIELKHNLLLQQFFRTRPTKSAGAKENRRQRVVSLKDSTKTMISTQYH